MGSKSTDSNKAIAAWEKAWGKKVPKGYVVHHKNGDPEDNSSDNLMIISRAKSNRLHKKGKTLAKQKFASKAKENIVGKELPQRRYRE